MNNLALLFFIIFGTKGKDVQNIQIKTISKELFTTTQQYEISCWTIKRAENYSSHTYKCSAGKRTVGWGFTNISKVRNIHHADEIFRDIRNSLFKQVDKVYPKLTYLQKAAIVSLYYNTGNLQKIKSSSFSKALQEKDNKKAVNSFKKWCKITINKKVITIKGLQNRRSYESKLLDGSFTMKDYVALKKEITNIYLLNKTPVSNLKKT